MAYETSALRGEPEQSRAAEDDYQSFSAALGASARGRAFLQEYARRNRHADTAVVLAALDRLESVARSQKAAPDGERIRQDLRALLDTIQSARPQIDQTPGAIKAATLSALIEFVQARIEALVAPAAAPGANGFLSPVPEPEQPELPIPRPGASAQRSIALVHAITQPADSEPVAARPAPDPFVLSLDTRIGPEFGQKAADVPPAPRATNIIPEIDFIDSLFEQIDAKAARQAAAAEIAATLSPPAVVAVPETAPPPSAAVLPPLDLQPAENAGALATPPAEASAAVGETAQAVAFGELIDLTGSDADIDAGADAATTARAEALVRAANATADAIDNIVAAAVEAMAEAAMAEAAAAAATPVETAVAETAVAETAIAESVIAEASPATVDVTLAASTATSEPPPVHAENQSEQAVAAAGLVQVDEPSANLAAEPVIQVTQAVTHTVTHNATHNAPGTAMADPAQHVWDNALTAIMALTDEERLALFT